MRLSENCEPCLLATSLSWRGIGMPDVRDWREVVVKLEEIQALVLECRCGFDDGFFIIKGVYEAHSYSNIAIVSCLYGEVLTKDKVINDSVGIYQGCVNTYLLLRPARWPFGLG